MGKISMQYMKFLLSTFFSEGNLRSKRKNNFQLTASKKK